MISAQAHLLSLGLNLSVFHRYPRHFANEIFGAGVGIGVLLGS